MADIDLLYSSRAHAAHNSLAELEILVASLDNNAHAGISGFLWRVGDTYFQALRGPEEAITELVEKLHEDTRHSGLKILMRRATPKGQPPFPWAMGYDDATARVLGLDQTPEDLDPREAVALFDVMLRKTLDGSDRLPDFAYSRHDGETSAEYKERLLTLLTREWLG